MLAGLYEALESEMLELGDPAPCSTMPRSEVDYLNQAVISARSAQSSTRELRSLSIKESERNDYCQYLLLSEGTDFLRRTFQN